MAETLYPMRKLLNLFVVLIFAVIWMPAHADVILLIHGYAGNAGSWQSSGINKALVTIASPHFGTELAEQALDLSATHFLTRQDAYTLLSVIDTFSQ